MISMTPTRSACKRYAWWSLFVPLLLVGHDARSQVTREEIIQGGTCRALVDHVVEFGATDSTGRSYKNSWGATERNVTTYLNDIALEDLAKKDKLPYGEVVRGKRASAGPKAVVCLMTQGMRLSFKANPKINVIEWQHKYPSDSTCGKEWKRMHDLIGAHELNHVKDYRTAIDQENDRLKTMRPATACGATRDEASVNLASAVVALMTAKATELNEALAALQAERDKERATMDCTQCVEQVFFNNAVIDCVIKNPVCSMQMTTRISGKVCGDPTSATWKMLPETVVSGCGVPSNASSDKWFDSDCVEAGSERERQRVAGYRTRSSGAGGWMCVYSAKPRPTVTIRSFRLAACQEPHEQTTVVDAMTSDTCDEPTAPPPRPSPPAKPLPNT